MGNMKEVFRISKKFIIERDLLNLKVQCGRKKTSDVSSRVFFNLIFWMYILMLLLKTVGNIIMSITFLKQGRIKCSLDPPSLLFC